MAIEREWDELSECGKYRKTLAAARALLCRLPFGEFEELGFCGGLFIYPSERGDRAVVFDPDKHEYQAKWQGRLRPQVRIERAK